MKAKYDTTSQRLRVEIIRRRRRRRGLGRSDDERGRWLHSFLSQQLSPSRRPATKKMTARGTGGGSK